MFQSTLIMVKLFLLLSILALMLPSVFPRIQTNAFKGYCRNTDNVNVDPSRYLHKAKGKTAGECLKECLKKGKAGSATACQFDLRKKTCTLYSEETAYGSGGKHALCYVFY